MASSRRVIRGDFVGDGSGLFNLTSDNVDLTDYAKLSGAQFTGPVTAPRVTSVFQGDGGLLTNIQSGSIDLAGYARLDGAAFTGVVQVAPGNLRLNPANTAANNTLTLRGSPLDQQQFYGLGTDATSLRSQTPTGSAFKWLAGADELLTLSKATDGARLSAPTGNLHVSAVGGQVVFDSTVAASTFGPTNAYNGGTFQNGTLSNATLNSSTLVGGNVVNSNIMGGSIDGNTIIANIQIKGSNLVGADFSTGTFSGVNTNRGTIKGGLLADVDITGASKFGGVLNGVVTNAGTVTGGIYTNGAFNGTFNGDHTGTLVTGSILGNGVANALEVTANTLTITSPNLYLTSPGPCYFEGNVQCFDFSSSKSSLFKFKRPTAVEPLISDGSIQPPPCSAMLDWTSPTATVLGVGVQGYTEFKNHKGVAANIGGWVWATFSSQAPVRANAMVLTGDGLLKTNRVSLGVGSGSYAAPLSIDLSGAEEYKTLRQLVAAKARVGAVSGSGHVGAVVKGSVVADALQVVRDGRGHVAQTLADPARHESSLMSLQIHETQDGSDVRATLSAHQVAQVLPGAVSVSPGRLPNVMRWATRLASNKLKLDAAPLDPAALAPGAAGVMLCPSRLDFTVVTYDPDTLTLEMDVNPPVERLFVHGTFVDDVASVDVPALLELTMTVVQGLVADRDAILSRLDALEQKNVG